MTCRCNVPVSLFFTPRATGCNTTATLCCCADCVAPEAPEAGARPCKRGRSVAFAAGCSEGSEPPAVPRKRRTPRRAAAPQPAPSAAALAPFPDVTEAACAEAVLVDALGMFVSGRGRSAVSVNGGGNAGALPAGLRERSACRGSVGSVAAEGAEEGLVPFVFRYVGSMRSLFGSLHQVGVA